MSLLYVLVAAAIAIVSLGFILAGPRTGAALGALAIAGLFVAFQQAAGTPAAPDGRQLAKSHVETTVERFRNPFLNHRLRDIAQNQAVKIERRVMSFLAWVHEVQPTVRLPRLSTIAARYE
jgi:mannitol-1-phosphate/altronate dehydrogenase